jgi:hypothetical protein
MNENQEDQLTGAIFEGIIPLSISLIALAALLVFGSKGISRIELTIIGILNVIALALLLRAYKSRNGNMALIGLSIGIAWHIGIIIYWYYLYKIATVRVTAWGVYSTYPSPKIFVGSIFLLFWYVRVSYKVYQANKKFLLTG